METVEMKFAVPKESFELANALGDIIVSMIVKGKDGFSGADVLSSIIENLDTIRFASEGLQALPEEMKSNPGLFAIPFILQAQRIIEATKPAPVALPESTPAPV